MAERPVPRRRRPWNQIGTQTKFYGRTLRSIRYAFTHYRVELIRLIAQMGLGTGALIVIGGTVAIVGFLTVTTGALVAVQGYNDFSEIGVEALTGFASAFFNVRLIAPATTAIALVGHHRRRRHRAARRDADQRGDRRARGDGYPQRRLPRLHPGGRRACSW